MPLKKTIQVALVLGAVIAISWWYAQRCFWSVIDSIPRETAQLRSEHALARQAFFFAPEAGSDAVESEWRDILSSSGRELPIMKRIAFAVLQQRFVEEQELLSAPNAPSIDWKWSRLLGSTIRSLRNTEAGREIVLEHFKKGLDGGNAELVSHYLIDPS